eukprot:SAG31_NODE_4263_length_3399_cov_2.469394_3_plen_106_part_00
MDEIQEFAVRGTGTSDLQLAVSLDVSNEVELVTGRRYVLHSLIESIATERRSAAQNTHHFLFCCCHLVLLQQLGQRATIHWQCPTLATMVEAAVYFRNQQFRYGR